MSLGLGNSEPQFNGYPLVCHLEVANSSKEPTLKVMRLALIARKYIEAGQREKGLQILEKAVQVAEHEELNSTETPETKILIRPWFTSPWLRIADAYVEAQNLEKAMRFPRKQELRIKSFY